MAFVNPSQQNSSEKKLTAAIVYGTTSGNAKQVAEAICDGLDSQNIDAKTYRAEESDANEVVKSDVIVLVCSTWNVGQLNDHFVKFNSDLEKLQLPGKDIEVVGLGDSKNYDIFCGAADVLEKTVAKVGGKQSLKTVRLDGPVEGLLEDMKSWGVMLATKL